MKIEYIKSSQINYHLWDQCIDRSFNRLIYAYSWYLDLLADDWDALIADHYSYVFPLPFRVKKGIKYVYMPHFTQQLGVFSEHPVTQEVTEAFLYAIPKEIKLVELNLNKFNSVSEAIWSEEKVNVELDLILSYEKLYSSYSTNLKRNLKKATRNHLHINKNIPPEKMVDLFAKNRGEELNVYSKEDYKKLVRLIYMLIYKGVAQVWGAYDSTNQLLSASLWVRSHERYIMLFTGLSEEGKSVAAMHYLIDAFIHSVAGTHAILDFEGSNDEGLQKFYMSFGSQRHTYRSIHINQLSPISKFLFGVYKKFR